MRNHSCPVDTFIQWCFYMIYNFGMFRSISREFFEQMNIEMYYIKLWSYVIMQITGYSGPFIFLGFDRIEQQIFVISLLKWNIGDTNTKLFELIKCPDFMCRETGGTEWFSCKLMKYDSALSEGTWKWWVARVRIKSGKCEECKYINARSVCWFKSELAWFEASRFFVLGVFPARLS